MEILRKGSKIEKKRLIVLVNFSINLIIIRILLLMILLLLCNYLPLMSLELMKQSLLLFWRCLEDALSNLPSYSWSCLRTLASLSANDSSYCSRQRFQVVSTYLKWRSLRWFVVLEDQPHQFSVRQQQIFWVFLHICWWVLVSYLKRFFTWLLWSKVKVNP